MNVPPDILVQLLLAALTGLITGVTILVGLRRDVRWLTERVAQIELRLGIRHGAEPPADYPPKP